MYVASFKELIVWQKAVELAKEIYIVTKKLPQSEVYGLKSQMCRSAVSVPSNIAEGKKRKTKKDFLHFLRMADGSAAELETQILIAEEVYGKTDFSRAKNILEEIQKMLATIIKKLEAPTSIS